MSKEIKSNCYECKNRGQVTGSRHSCCDKFPFDLQLKVGLLYMKGAVIELEDKKTSEKFPLVKLDPHGVSNGWCDWPIQFDPVWVSECYLFEQKI